MLKAKILAVLTASLMLVGTASAYTFTDPHNQRAHVDLNGRINLNYLRTGDHSYFPIFKSYKQSFIALSPWFSVGNAQLGFTDILSFENNFAQPKHFNTYLQKAYVFIKSPSLGQTSIGRTTGVLEDYFRDSQNFHYTQSSYYPFTRDLNHLLTWKYVSSSQRYYTYGVSFVNNEDTDYGTYGQASAQIQWKFNPGKHHAVVLRTLYSRQKAYFESGGIIKMHPTSIGLAYRYKNKVLFNITPYFAREELMSSNHAVPVITRDFGVYYSVAYNPTDKFTVYFNYSLHRKDNKSDQASVSFNGETLAPHSANYKKVIGTGFSADYNKYISLFFEYHVELTKVFLYDKTNRQYYYNTGIQIIF